MISRCKKYASADKKYASADKKYASANIRLLKCFEFASKSEHFEAKKPLIYIYIYINTETPSQKLRGFSLGDFPETLTINQKLK
jgi:hypothetical protein